MKNLILRTVTGIVFIAAVIFSILYAKTILICFVLLFLFFLVAGSLELVRMAEKKGISPNAPLAILLPVSVFVAVACLPHDKASVLFLALSGLTFSLVFICEIFRKKENALQNVALSFLPLLWIGIPFVALLCMVRIEPEMALSIFVIIWLNDTLAYCAGSLFGKHRLCERISPKKSIEGFVAALVLTMLVSGCCFPLVREAVSGVIPNICCWLGFALVVILAGTLGDLVESLVKRDCGVKDSGNILPGHGGILDRFDSVLMAIPAAFVYLLTIAALV